MALKEALKNEIIEIVAMSFETGHFSELDELELAGSVVEHYPELNLNDQKQVYEQAREYYLELVNYGPVGFYEEFKDVYDFDPMFVEEYGHYYDDEDDEDEDDEFDPDGRDEMPWDYGKHFDQEVNQ